MAIYDCFQYFNEEHIADLRFNILNEFVDHFVIVESTVNHQGKDKKLQFDINKYQKFKKKIKYIIVDDTPENIKKPHEGGESLVEQYQRNSLMKILNKANDEDLILTAHHKDDQVETIFFRFLRGTGLNGLKGIPAWRKDKYISYHRPLLGFSKKQLRQYAETNELKWVEDESNKDTNISRNFIRNNLVPKIKEKWPNVEKSILHLSSEATKSNNILRSVAKEDLEKISSKKNYYD